MDDAVKAELRGLIDAFRRKHGGSMFTANTMHSGWEDVFDAEAILRGEPSRFPVESVLASLRRHC